MPRLDHMIGGGGNRQLASLAFLGRITGGDSGRPIDTTKGSAPADCLRAPSQDKALTLWVVQSILGRNTIRTQGSAEPWTIGHGSWQSHSYLRY